MFMEGVPMFHTSYDMGNNINYGSMYLVLGGVSLGREFLMTPGCSPRGGVTVHDWVASTNIAWFPK